MLGSERILQEHLIEELSHFLKNLTKAVWIFQEQPVQCSDSIYASLFKMFMTQLVVWANEKLRSDCAYAIIYRLNILQFTFIKTCFTMTRPIYKVQL